MTQTPNAISHKPKTALVTGASGFIGSQLVRILLDEGVKVRALVQKGVPLQNLNGVDVEQVEGDLLDSRSLERAMEGCDTLFHLAAIFDYWLKEPALMFRVNVEGTVAVLEAAKAAGVQRVVKCSSIAGIGTLPGTQVSNEETPFNGWDVADDYVLSKYIGELEAMRFNLSGLPVVAVLPGFPFGGRDIAPTPTGMLIQRYITGQNPFVFKGGMCAVNVKDVARGHYLAATRGRPGERYILGGHNVTNREFANLTCDIAGVKRPRFDTSGDLFAKVGVMNEWIARRTGIKPYVVEKGVKYIAGRYLYADSSKAKHELGYSPGTLEDAIRDAVEWFTQGRERTLESVPTAMAAE